MNSRLVFVFAGVAVSALLMVAIVVIMSEKGDETLSGMDRANQLERELREKDEILKNVERKLESAEEELRVLRGKRTTNPEAASGGMAPVPEGESGAPGDSSVAKAAPKRASDDADAEAKKPKQPATWDAMAEQIVKMLDIFGALEPPKDGKGAAPKQDPGLQAEAMKILGNLMTEIGEMQGKLGLDDPGYVTESPAFKGRMIAGILEKMGKPLSDSEKEAFFKKSDEAMTSYLEAAKGSQGEFALERIRKTSKCVESFNDEMTRTLGEKMSGVPMLGEPQGSGSAKDTWWPDQSCTGVKDQEEAVQSIKKQWQSKMGIPEGETSGLEPIVREYVHRSGMAESRIGGGAGAKATAAERRALDQEIAGYQVEALKRIHDSLNIDEQTKQKVRKYRSLDRFELGSNGSWSRSGSFGSMRFSSGSSGSDETGKD